LDTHTGMISSGIDNYIYAHDYPINTMAEELAAYILKDGRTFRCVMSQTKKPGFGAWAKEHTIGGGA